MASRPASLRGGIEPARAQAWLFAIVVLAALGVIVAFLVLAELTDHPFSYFTKEPAESLDGDLYVGWLAHLTATVWLAAAAIGCFAGLSLRRSGLWRQGSFLLAGGVLSTLLGADDLFLLHEAVYPRLGIPQEAVFIAYAALVAAFLLAFRVEILAEAWVLLAVAVACWAGAAFADVMQHAWEIHHVVEDGAKIVGVALWTAFLVRAASRQVSAALAGGGTADARRGVR